MTETSLFEHAARWFEPKPRRWASPGDLARALEPETRTSAPLEMIDRELVRLADHQVPADGIMIFMPPQEGKLLSHDTPVPTPSGWITHGELKPGDEVFHPSGKPVRVLAVSAPAEASLIVRTSDHGAIKVHPNHEWTVYDRSRGKHGPYSYSPWRTVDTAYLLTQRLASGPAGKRGHYYRFLLPFREPLELPDSDLPIDPYTLGVWLGDGSSTKAAITHHPDDQYELPYPQSARCVHPTTGIITTYYRGGMAADLRAAGVWGSGSKHIPAAYLRASEKQRRALLAGLIDTDGHVSASGQVSFDNANEQMVRDTAELLRTLGYRAHVHRPTPPKLSSSGSQGKQAMWRVTYTPHDEGPARLARKAAVKLGIQRRVAIIAIEPCEPTAGRCITVDSPDGLYLAGEQFTPTHNSQRVSRRFPEWLLAHDPSLRIAVVSYEAEMATRWGRQIKRDIAQADPRLLNVRIMADSSAAGRWDTPEGGGIYCVGIGGSLSGRPVDCLVIDDPVKDREAAESATLRERAWDWWESVAIPRLAPGGTVCLMMTRWQTDDLAGRILSRPSPLRWRVLSLPAIAVQNDPLGRPPGTEFPSVRQRAAGYFARLRATMSAYVFSGIYQQSPVAAEGNMFRTSAYRYWQPPAGLPGPATVLAAGRTSGAWIELEGRRVDLADPAVWKFATVDLAASTRTSADYTVVSVWAIDREGDLILLDRRRAQVEMADHFAMARPLRAAWRYDVLYVPREYWSKTLVVDARAAGVPVAEVTTDADKVTRAIPAAGRVHAGKVWFPAVTSGCECGSCPPGGVWLAEWESELAAFPRGTNDDQVDTLSAAARVTAAHWVAPAPPARPQVLSAGQAAIDLAFDAATGNGHGPPPDLMSMPLG